MEKYGRLLTPDAKIQRQYFKELTQLYGIQVIYRAPREGKHYTTYAEIDSNYYEPVLVGCIFDEHPTQKTLKKIGWTSELQTESSLISVPYDLDKIQSGALFMIPSGLDNGKARLFRVKVLSNIMIYPASITCEIVPEYENIYASGLNDFKRDSMNVLNDEEE